MDGDERLLLDRTPGVEHEEPTASVLSYTAGLGLAVLADDHVVRRVADQSAVGAGRGGRA